MTIDIHQFPCLQDNYGFLVRDRATGEAATIDTPEAEAILREAARLGWKLTTILNTHWHPDHAGGNAAIREATGAIAIGPAEVAGHFPLDRAVVDGDIVQVGETRLTVMESGGHTLGHIVYYDADNGVLFAGDTLFPMGCGRLFEGTAEQMWTSLSRIAALPADTTVYSAHEYTLSNGRFAVTVDDSAAVAERTARVAEARAAGRWTVPTTIAEERATNPFLRAPGLPLGQGAASPAEAFGRVRAAKDAYRG